jgi:hypothetical protein
MSTAVPEIEKIPAAKRQIWPESMAVFFSASLVYLFLRSHDIVAVDGAIRAFLVYQRPLTVTVDTHMLYRFWVWLWVRCLATVGYHPAGPLEYWRAVQAMNCVAAASCVAILYDLIRRMTGSAATAMFGACAWGAAHAVLLHATNSAEPMAGLWWSVVALALTQYGLWRRSYVLLVLAGVALALAMGSYRSMVFMGLACGLLTLLSPTSSRITEPLKRAAVLTASFLVSLVALFGTVAYMQHARTVQQGVQMSAAVDSRDVYLGLTLSKVVNSFVGYVNGLVVAVPSEYGGLRWLISTHVIWVAWLAICMMAVYLATWVLLRRGVHRREARILYISCGASFLLGLVLLWSWVPMYDKLWLQPLWLMVLMLSVAAPDVRFRKALAGLVICMAVVNLAVTWQASRGPWLNFDESQRVATVVKPNDLLVAGWSSMSVIYRHIWGIDANNFDFPYQAGVGGAGSIALLQQRIQETHARGGRVYFLDILDQTQPEWDAFLGAHCGVPYAMMQPYREQVTEVTRFSSNGRQVRLMELR